MVALPELVLAPLELPLDDVPLVEPLDEPLPVFVLVPSWLSKELRLLPEVAPLVVVIVSPFHFPE
jgi:hypothetical protein